MFNVVNCGSLLIVDACDITVAQLVSPFGDSCRRLALNTRLKHYLMSRIAGFKFHTKSRATAADVDSTVAVVIVGVGVEVEVEG